MTILFLIFIGLAVYHFWWEMIIAPSLRLKLRYDLFEIRDHLRRLKIEHGDNLSDETFEALQHIINNELAFLHRVEISDLYVVQKEYASNQQLKKKVERFERLIQESSVDELKSIWEKSNLVFVCALLVNSGGWLIYVVPIILALVSFGIIKKLTKLLLGLSDNDLNKIFPQPPRTATA